MNPGAHHHEILVCLQQQDELYRRVLLSAAELQAAMVAGEPTDDCIARIHEGMQQAAEIEDSHRAAKESWLDAGGRPDEVMRLLLDSIQHSLEQLLPVIREAEDRVQQAKDRLSPQLEIQSRGARMRNAYASAAATAEQDV